MRINRETGAGKVACCHWVRSSHTLFPPKERNPLLHCAEGAPSSKASAPLPLRYRLPPFRSALLLGSPPFGELFLGCHPIAVSSFWGAILLRSNPFWMLCFGVLSFWGAILFGAIPLRCYPFGVHPLEYYLFCADWVSLREVLEFNVTMAIFCFTQLLLFTVSIALPPCPGYIWASGRNSSVQAAVCPMWGRRQMSQRPVIVLSPWEKEASNDIYLCTCCTSCHGYWIKANVATADLSKGQYWITENKQIGWEINSSHRELDIYWLYVQPTVYITHSTQSLA